MNPVFKKYLVVAVKHAVNAALLSLGPVYHSPKDYNLHSWHGLAGVCMVAVSAIVIREAMVWGPKLMKWSQTGLEVPEDLPEDAVSKGAGK